MLVAASCSGDGTAPKPIPSVRSVQVTPPAASIRVGDTQALTSVVDVLNGASTTVTWTTESPAVATVSSQGIVTGVAAGTAIVRATSTADTRVSGTSTITVAAIRSVTITPATNSIATGEQRTLAVNVQLDAGLTRTVTWRSSAPAVVSVTQTGVVTGVSLGTSTITAVAVADTSVSGSATVIVAPSVRSVVVTPAAASLFINGTQALTATVAADAGVAQTVGWRTNNPTIATVSAAGVVTALAVGQASITAVSSVDSTKRASSAITVNPRPLIVAIVQRNVGVNPGTSTQLTVNVSADPNVNAAVNWTSSVASVATVSSTGLVAGVSIGTTLVTATSQFDATKRDTVTVSVVPRLAASWSSSRLGGALFEDILSVAAFGANSAFAVNVFGDIYRWDGTAWALSTRGSTFGTQFVALHGSGSSNILAVGTGGAIARLNGTAWSRMTSGTTRDLASVFMESATSAFAVGASGTVLRLAGTTWSTLASGSTASLNGVWALAGQAVIAGNGGELLRYDGATFARQTVATTEDLFAVGGTVQNSLVVVGSAGTVLRFDGTTWTLVNSNGVTGDLFAVVPGAANRLYLAGDNGLVSLDGTAIAAVNTPYAPRMYALSVDANGVLWTGGQRGFVQRGTTSGNSTGFETLNLAPDLLDVWSTAANSAWSVGEFGFIYRWNGAGWTRQTTPTTATLTTVWAASESDAFAGGDNGVVLRWNGTSWSTMTFPSAASILSMWGTSNSNVYAATTSGEVVRYNGTAWTLVATTPNALWAVFGASPSDVYASGESGTVLRFNGTTWSPLAAPSTATLAGVWMSGSDNVLAFGADASGATGVAYRFNGTSWQTLSVGTTRLLTSVWGPSVSDVYATGDAGILLRFDGASWVTMPTGTTDLLWSLSGAPNGVGGAFAVGYNGTIVAGASAGGMVTSVLGAPARGSLEPSAAARASRVSGRALPTGAARRLRKQASRR